MWGRHLCEAQWQVDTLRFCFASVFLVTSSLIWTCFIGTSLSKPHIIKLYGSNCYVCMYVCMHVRYLTQVTDVAPTFFAVSLRRFPLKFAKTSAAWLHPFRVLPMRIPEALRRVYAYTYVPITQSFEWIGISDCVDSRSCWEVLLDFRATVCRRQFVISDIWDEESSSTDCVS